MTKRTIKKSGLCATAFTILIFILSASMFCGCGKKSDYEYRLTYSVFFPPVHIQAMLAMGWAKEIEARSNGRVKIEVFPGGVLSGASENYDCVANSVSDIGMSCLSYSRGLFPLSECLDFPLGYPNGRIATQVANDFLKHFKPKEFNETEMLYLHAHGPGVIASKTKVSCLADLHNMSIRGTGITAQIIKALGGNAVGLPQGETFEALRKGVVGGTLCPIETLKGWKQGEVIEYVTEIPAIGYTTTMFVTMNKITWSKLPEDIRQIILDVTWEWIPKHGLAWDEADKEGREFVTSLQKQFSVFSPVEDKQTAEKLEPMIQAWIQQAEGKGLPGREAIQFIRDRIAYYKRLEGDR